MKYFVLQLALQITFFMIFVPLAMFGRLVKYDPLKIRFKPDSESHWIKRK